MSVTPADNALINRMHDTYWSGHERRPMAAVLGVVREHDAQLADALWSLLVALGKHTADMTPAQLADICPACDEASAALIASGRVMG